MLELDASVIGSWIGSLFWPFVRIGTFFMVAPIIGAQLVPVRIRILLALLVSMAVAPHIPAVPQVDLLSVENVPIVIQQMLIGLGMGYALQFLLQMFVMAGQLIAMKMGLGFASMVDPTSGVSVPVVSQFHLLMVTLLFLVVNGHLVMIDVLAASFEAIPVSGSGLSSTAYWHLAGMLSWMMAGALLIALPAITALLIVNSTLGVITRAAPQLNIFSIGFPFMVLLGLGIIWVSMTGYLPHFERYSADALEMMALLPRY